MIFVSSGAAPPGSREMPALALPDGAQLLLHGYDPEVVRAEIDRCGSFTTAGPNHLFAERPTVICALPDGSGRHLIQPASGAGRAPACDPRGCRARSPSATSTARR